MSSLLLIVPDIVSSPCAKRQEYLSIELLRLKEARVIPPCSHPTYGNGKSSFESREMGGKMSDQKLQPG